MTALLFPVFGAVIVFLVAVPLLSIAAYCVLAVLPRSQSSIDAHASPMRYALIVGPVLGPILWLASAAIHQSEPGAPIAACVIEHLGAEVCRDIVLFGCMLFIVPAAAVLLRAIVARTAVKNTPVSAGLHRRVSEACAANGELAGFARRIRVVSNGRAPVCTLGLFRPAVEIEAALVSQLTDTELLAVLLHEVAHARGQDPLRFFIAQVALTINPLSRLLRDDFARYSFAREALCDRRAVQQGADPLSLAGSIVRVAGRPVSSFVAALGGHGLSSIRVRVQFLLGYATLKPTPAPRSNPVGSLTLTAALLMALPHVTGTVPLDVLHTGIETAALYLGLR